jgi:hypothetical protein
VALSWLVCLGRASLPHSLPGGVAGLVGLTTTAAAAPLPNVGGCLCGAGMPNQPEPGESSPPPRRLPSPSGRRSPGGQPTPHDSVFRQIFGVPENAASQLRAVLPPGVAGRLDLDRLSRVPAIFVDEALKWRYSDLLFTAPLDGRDASCTCWSSTRAALTR